MENTFQNTCVALVLAFCNPINTLCVTTNKTIKFLISTFRRGDCLPVCRFDIVIKTITDLCNKRSLILTPSRPLRLETNSTSFSWSVCLLPELAHKVLDVALRNLSTQCQVCEEPYVNKVSSFVENESFFAITKEHIEDLLILYSIQLSLGMWERLWRKYFKWSLYPIVYELYCSKTRTYTPYNSFIAINIISFNRNIFLLGNMSTLYTSCHVSEGSYFDKIQV